MEVDKTTLKDLNIITGSDHNSLIDKLDHTRTLNGRNYLTAHFLRPLQSIKAIREQQDAIKLVAALAPHWPESITNGTLLMIEKFYVTSVDLIPAHPSELSAFTYRVLSAPDYSMVKYSVGHIIDFLKGMKKIVEALQDHKLPVLMEQVKVSIQNSLASEKLKTSFNFRSADDIPKSQMLKLAHYLRYQYKNSIHALIHEYSKLDAFYSMAMAAKELGYHYPVFIEDVSPHFEVQGLFHPLVEQAVDYDLALSKNQNFLFLTGANMAGKSTFIKASGIAVYLAHLGMAVPAKQMQLSYFHGLLSNINIADDVVKGQSFFYNEVRRIKETVTMINDGNPWFILIDELFKGTNVQDAMKCSTTVIEGLLKIKASTFIISTHLYEIGDGLRRYPNIVFKYFETHTGSGQLQFSYQLKDGISNDRLGYVILQNEGVVDLLNSL